MRFCMVTTFYPPYHFGGDAVFVQALARGLTEAGHQVEVVHCEDAYRLKQAAPPVTAKNPTALSSIACAAGLDGFLRSSHNKRASPG